MSILLIAGVSWALGTWVLRALRLEPAGPAWPLRLLAGGCLCGLLVLPLGLYSLQAARLALYAVAVLGLGYEAVIRDTLPWSGLQAIGRRAGWRVFDYACALMLLLGLSLSLVSALTRPLELEETTVHLALARAWADSVQLGYVEAEPLSAYATPLHSLYAYTLFDGGLRAARALSWLIGVLACGAAYGLGRRVGGRRVGWLAAAMLATAPVFFEETGTVSVDLAVAGLAAAALWMWAEWHEEGDPTHLVLAGFLAGGAAVVRPSGLILLGLLALATGLVPMMARLRRPVHAATAPPEDPPPPPKPGQMDLWADPEPDDEAPAADDDGLDDDFLAPERRGAPGWLQALLGHGDALGVLALPALLALLPWWIHALASGAPTLGFPYAGNLADLLSFAVHPSPGSPERGSFLMYAWDIVMRPFFHDGWVHSPGGLVLFIGVPGLVVGGPWARRLGTFAILGGLMLYLHSRSGQAMLPFFVPMMAVAALAVVRMPRWRNAVAVLVLAYLAYHAGLDALRLAWDPPGGVPRPYRDAYEWLETDATTEGRVLAFDARAYLIPAETYRNYPAVARQARLSGEQARQWLKSRRIRYMLYPRTELEAIPGYMGSVLDRVVSEWQGNPRVFRKLQAFSGPDGTVEVYRAAWQ